MPYKVEYSGKPWSKSDKNSGWLKVHKTTDKIASHHRTRSLAKDSVAAYYARRKRT